ncbi:MAG: putative quinol monooxygenase [Rikenellaceae bacterium]
MEKELKIAAVITAKSQYNELIFEALKEVVDNTRKEEGNISYVLHQDLKEPLKYVIFEHWKSQEDLDIHESSDHFKKLVETIDGKTAAFEVLKVKEIY